MWLCGCPLYNIPLALRQAAIAVAVKPKNMMVATMYAMTLSLLIQIMLLNPMVWNALQNPCVRWNNKEANKMT